MADLDEFTAFIAALREKRGISDLDARLAQLLIEMQLESSPNAMSPTAQKFLALCFSFWGDGDTRVPLDAKKFKEKWNGGDGSDGKLSGLLKLKTAAEENVSSDVVTMISNVGEIIDAGTKAFAEGTFGRIATAVETECDFDKLSSVTPLLICPGLSDKIPYLYPAKYFKAKLVIQERMKTLFKRNGGDLKDDGIKACTASISEMTDEKLVVNDRQAEAVIRGKTDNLVITGGPGTGKTTVVLHILWNLFANEDGVGEDDKKHDWPVYLVAPSGKAAERMSESLKKGLEQITEKKKTANPKIYDKM